MTLHPRVKPSARSARIKDDWVDLLVARIVGQAEGPLFDRRAVPPGLLDDFARRADVRQSTRRFALELGQLWQACYPDQPMLRIAGRRSAPGPVRAGSGHQPRPPAMTPMPTTAAPSPRLVLVLPNAKVGEAYRAAVDARDDSGAAATVLQLMPPDGIGIAHDPDAGVVHGTPTQAGDHVLGVRWQDAGGGVHDATLVLIVNANPRDLWKQVDADPADPYFKPNHDARLLDAGGGRRIAAASTRGRSHAHAGTCRDDDFCVAHDAASGWSTLVVADGAGSAKSSRKGAALAAAMAGDHLLRELAGAEGGPLQAAVGDWRRDAASAARPLKDRLYTLFGKAAWAAMRAIEDEAGARSAEVRDYATTLLCAIHCPVPDGIFVASFWLGDGAICAYGPPPGNAVLMGKPDGGEYAGQTRFLDRNVLGDASGLWGRIEFGCHDALTALLLMTDGVSDPRFETDSGLAQAAKWDALWAELAPALDAAAPEQALLAWLDFFSPGHHDDRTLALIW